MPEWFRNPNASASWTANLGHSKNTAHLFVWSFVVGGGFLNISLE